MKSAHSFQKQYHSYPPPAND